MSRINGTALVDLTPHKSGAQKYEASAVLDDVGRPDEVELRLTLSNPITPQQLFQPGGLDYLRDREIITELDDDTTISGKILAVANQSLRHTGEVTLRLLLNSTQRKDPSANAADTKTWSFGLSNLTLSIGDATTSRPVPDNAGASKVPAGWTRNKIHVTVGGREWTLTDLFIGSSRTKKEGLDITKPLHSGTLSTPFQADEEAEAVSQIATDLTSLLSFALGRGVEWVSRSALNAEGKAKAIAYSGVFLTPFKQQSPAPVDNFAPGVLKGFLEGAYPAYVSDREWFHRTIGFFRQVQMNPFVEIKAAILNILLDRIAASIVADAGGHEIDRQLPSRLDDRSFREALHDLFQKQTEAWNLSRTDALIGVVKNWNASPSFGEGVKRACVELRIPEPPGKLLRLRHKLLHVGELDPAGEELHAYWKELESLALMMILRLLSYEGQFFHSRFGSHPVTLKDKLASS